MDNYLLPKNLQGTVLARILESRLPEIAGARQKWPEEAIRNVLDRAPVPRSLKKALSCGKPAVIAELKKASPSAGLLRADFHPVALARELQESGAAAFSVITEVKHFQGGLENLASLRWHTKLPLLRKDFVVDSYQVLEARHAGADAILLIAALLDSRSLAHLRGEIEALGMEALIEVHDETELDAAIDSGATLIGVNNRDLRTFDVTLETALRLAPKIPRNAVAVAESGIRCQEDVRRLWDAGFRGFLIGEQLMRAVSPGSELRKLIPTESASRRAS
jgi:indole-3-glycerol phosphate synthase